MVVEETKGAKGVSVIVRSLSLPIYRVYSGDCLPPVWDKVSVLTAMSCQYQHRYSLCLHSIGNGH